MAASAEWHTFMCRGIKVTEMSTLVKYSNNSQSIYYLIYVVCVSDKEFVKILLLPVCLGVCQWDGTQTAEVVVKYG